LCSEAQRQLVKLRALVDETDRDGDTNASEREGAVYRAYSASRFGFEQALREWPDFAEARAGLRHTLRALARYELRMRRLDRARALLVDIDDEPSLEIEIAAVARTVEAEERERARLVDVGRSFLFRDGSRRLFVTGALLAMTPWLLFAFFAGSLVRTHELIVTPMRMALANVLPSVGFAVLALWLRKRDVFAGKTAAVSAACCAVIVAMWLVLRTSVTIDEGFVLSHCILLLDVVVGALFIRAVMALVAVPVLLSLPVLVALPDYVFEVNTATLVLVLVILAATWPRSAALK
jgi:hypothetical protein